MHICILRFQQICSCTPTKSEKFCNHFQPSEENIKSLDVTMHTRFLPKTEYWDNACSETILLGKDGVLQFAFRGENFHKMRPPELNLITSVNWKINTMEKFDHENAGASPSSLSKSTKNRTQRSLSLKNQRNRKVTSYLVNTLPENVMRSNHIFKHQWRQWSNSARIVNLRRTLR